MRRNFLRRTIHTIPLLLTDRGENCVRAERSCFSANRWAAILSLHACDAWFNDYLDSTMAKTITPEGVREVKVTHYPGGCRGGWYKLGRKAEYFVKLQAKGIFREIRIGKAAVTVCNAAELADAMRELFAADPAILLHKKGCADCARLRSKLINPE